MSGTAQHMSPTEVQPFARYCQRRPQLETPCNAECPEEPYDIFDSPLVGGIEVWSYSYDVGAGAGCSELRHEIVPCVRECNDKRDRSFDVYASKHNTGLCATPWSACSKDCQQTRMWPKSPTVYRHHWQLLAHLSIAYNTRWSLGSDCVLLASTMHQQASARQSDGCSEQQRSCQTGLDCPAAAKGQAVLATAAVTAAAPDWT
eukprot:4499-Heterococcus_DN1.PRE.1